ncbi:phosphatidylinositide phosphatase SAC2-like [Ylistrum balloti]|uniref:phosphatidylinositide phosphatase SAC2-like n=1 Tax=Ylistrum balloti TaxID=509963 RepID=UPI002905DA26|nr:phosphatidylinositide phosphatase SAC2-like [Ylistrum balloti]
MFYGKTDHLPYSKERQTTCHILKKDRPLALFYDFSLQILTDDQETYEAFKAHFDEQLSIYRSIVAINLAELCGKEKAISDAYLKHLLTYNSPDITYVMFDFHEYCRGMKFENVSILTDGINDILKKMRYCWVDKKGMICEQRGVFRENCVDCLDRTNVVQTAIARIVMETQCRKLGILAPEENLPQSCKLTFQQLWANNGDVISRQYAGTAALKGDFTRTGERKFSGMMKDGMNSANRYYLRFKDSYRQASIDLTLGRPVTMEEFLLLGNSSPEEEEDVAELMEKEQNLKLLVEECKEMLIVEPEQCLGGWSLINADPVCGDPDRSDMDMILLLSQRAVYVAWYDDEEEQLVQYQRIFLEDIENIEIGLEPSLFKSKFVCMRLHYTNFAEDGFFHTFRTPRTRLFNNMVIAVRNQEESRESLKAIHQAFAAARQIFSLDLEAVDRQKLDRKKTKPHPEVQDIHKQQQENALTGIHIPRDISSPDLTYKHKGLVSPDFQRKGHRSPDIQRQGLSPNSPGTSGNTSPSTSPGRLRHNILPNFANVRKSLNSGIKLNFNVPKFSLQNVSLSKRFGSAKSKEDIVDGSNNSDDVIADELTQKKSKPALVKERTYSQDDSTVGTSTSSFDETIQADDDNIMLDSCGIITKCHLGSSIDEPEESSECLKEIEQEVDSLKLQQDIEDQSDETKDNAKDVLHKEEDAEGDDDAFLVIEDSDVEKLLASSSKTVPKIQTEETVSSIKVPKIVTSAAKTRKLQRIMDILQEDISEMLEGKTCLTQIVIV